MYLFFFFSFFLVLHQLPGPFPSAFRHPPRPNELVKDIHAIVRKPMGMKTILSRSKHSKVNAYTDTGRLEDMSVASVVFCFHVENSSLRQHRAPHPTRSDGREDSEPLPRPPPTLLSNTHSDPPAPSPPPRACRPRQCSRARAKSHAEEGLDLLIRAASRLRPWCRCPAGGHESRA